VITNNVFSSYRLWNEIGYMGVERGAGVAGLPWILNILAKKDCFSISRCKKQISPLLAPRKNFGKIP